MVGKLTAGVGAVRPKSILSTTPKSDNSCNNYKRRVTFEQSLETGSLETDNDVQCCVCFPDVPLAPFDSPPVDTELHSERRRETSELMDPNLKVLKSPPQPSAREIAEHEATHLPYRA